MRSDISIDKLRFHHEIDFRGRLEIEDGAGKRCSVTDEMVGLRRRLHQLAELSGSEERTAALLEETLKGFAPDGLVTGLGGHGLAARFDGAAAGPRVLIRCDLDALPIDEGPHVGEEASETPGVSHKCGHDGHMAVVTAVARALGRNRPARGSVVLLYQPAEETGAGAMSVLNDPAFADLEPDAAFALHNVPGFPLGQVVTREGVFASTARSLRIHLVGRTSHAAEPERGLSPTLALADILSAWPGTPQASPSIDEPALVTVVHARLGEPALGTTPGEAIAIATLRARSPEVMDRLSERCLDVAMAIAAAHGLEARARWMDEFPCTQNDHLAVEVIRRAAASAGADFQELDAPFRWTEDFGHYTSRYPSAMFGLGAGEQTAPLHHPDYRFPDELIAVGCGMFLEMIAIAPDVMERSTGDRPSRG